MVATSSVALNHSHPGSDWPDWVRVLRAIRMGKCVPFLGAGACAGTLPLARELASELARRFEYPFTEHDLARVSQFVETHPNHSDDPREIVAELLRKTQPPNWGARDQIHSAIASLPIRVYVTTNYDDFMMTALRRAGKKARFSRSYWNGYMQDCLLDPKFRPPNRDEILPLETANPTLDEPLVFHLHGAWDDTQSMVLTEDDYLEYLTRVSSEHVIPPRLRRAFMAESLLFLGYGLQDWDLKVVFAMIANIVRRHEKRHFSVQLSPRAGDTPTESERQLAEKQRAHLEHQFGLKGIRVYWGTCTSFAAELRERWAKFEQDGAP